eukprot:gene2740-5611_t
MPLAAQTCRVAAITNGRIMSRAHKYLSVRASNLQQNRGYTFRSLHTAVGLHTKYPPRDGQFDMKIATLRPASPSTPDDFIKALGLSKNGVIGQLATVIVPDITSRTGAYNCVEPVPPSAPRSRKTKHSFLLLDQNQKEDFMKNVTEYIFPETEGLDKDYPLKDSIVLSREPQCGNRRFNFVFVDTSAGQTHWTRNIRIRERDGTLRTATREEHERYNQEFFAQPYKRHKRPDICKDENLSFLFKTNRHKMALDFIVRHLHPYQRDYREVHERVYNDIVKAKKFNALQDSQHWPAFVRWLIRTQQAAEIYIYTPISSITDAAKLVHYIKKGLPVVPDSVEEHRRIVADYLQHSKQTNGRSGKSN